MEEAQNGFIANAADCYEEEDGVGQGYEDGAFAVSVCVVVGRFSLCEVEGDE